MELNYIIQYSDRKTLGLSVERDKSIVIRAPKNVTSESIGEFIERKKYWLFKKLNHPQKYRPQQKKEFISGAAILYLGRNYKLNVINKDLEGIKFDKAFLISKKNQYNASDLFKEWYLEKAKEKIVKKSKHHAKNMGVEFGNINISELKYRWGSCTPKNNLNFNWKLMKAPSRVIDYVIVHELAHLIENNHTPKFWGIVKVQVPNYAESKQWLKENGQILEVDF